MIKSYPNGGLFCEPLNNSASHCQTKWRRPSKTKVRAGECATESEVTRNGLPALLNRDRDIETGLQNEVGSAYDALKSNPSRAITADQVRARLVTEDAKVR